MEMLGNLIASYNGLDEKMQTLRSNVVKLSCKETDITLILKVAELQPGKKRKHEVENWLKNVEWTKNKVQIIEQEERKRNLSSLPSLGNRIDKLNEGIAVLLEQGKFEAGLLLPEIIAEPLLTTKLIGQAFEQNLEKVLKHLMDDKVLRIGIYGMGGVGKTALVLHIHNTLLEKSETFGRVYFISVSQDFSIGKLQSDIAKTLQLCFRSEDDEKKRAAKLSKELTGNTRCILILDDVWNNIPLHRVGIPSRVNGCKLILTTRSFDVCCRMDCQANIKVKPLSEVEAWNLFREKLGQHTALSPEVIELANSVAAECAGLPLGIITMAASMRGVNDICEWRNVLEDLKELTMGQQDMENEVLPILKLSYSRLNDKKLQHCFLYCTFYPEDCQIERNELIRYFIAEGLIEARKNLQAKFDEGHTMLNKLERSCLLERCSYGCVKIHDLIRDMALKITKAGDLRFMVKAGVRLKEIPNVQEWTEDLDKVSLMMNWIKEVPQDWSPRCPKLSTLIMRKNPITSIANSFFEHMHALQVLDLSDNCEIIELPNSISDLENLTALLLGRCRSLTYVPPLGKLRALRELDLSGTRIKEMPQGVDRLVNLKNLNMEWTEKLEMIPSGTFGRLSHLQHVILHCMLGPVEVQEEELEGMRELEEFFVRLHDVGGFFQIIQSLQRRGGPLNKYSLQLVGAPKFHREVEVHKNSYSKAVILRKSVVMGAGEDGTALPYNLHFPLPYDLQFLEINGCYFASRSCLCDVFPSLCGKARQLKLCVIRDCVGIECILSLCFSSSSSVSFHNKEETQAHEDQLGESRHIAFGLEKLYLSDLPDLRLGFGVIAPYCVTFSSLEELEIICCPKIKKLFFSNNHDGNNETTILLPKLAMLKLVDLPQLESIYEGILICDSIEVIEIRKCPKLKRLPFLLPLVDGQPSAPTALEEIMVGKDTKWWESLEWDHPNTKDILQPYLSLSATYYL